MAVVDAKHQIVVHSEAFGQGQEHNLLAPVLEGVRESFKAPGRDKDILEGIRVTADAGLHSEAKRWSARQFLGGLLSVWAAIPVVLVFAATVSAHFFRVTLAKPRCGFSWPPSYLLLFSRRYG